MPQSETQNAYATVAELRRLLRVVLPHLSKDPTLPVLGDVEVTMAGHSLTMAATDRFTVAAAWTDLTEMAPATDWTNTVSGRCLAMLARMLPRTKASADTIVTITATDSHLAVQIPNQRLADFAEYPTWTIPATGRGFIKWRPIIDNALTATGESAGASLNPAMMTRWAHLTDGTEPVHVLMTAPKHPMVLIAKKAIGLQMPLRMASDFDPKDHLAAPWHALAAA
jgi:hypothetical protein